MLKTKERASSSRALIQKLKILKFRLGMIKDWYSFCHVMKGYTIWNTPIMYFLDKKYRADLQYKRIIQSIYKEYDWIEEIQQVFDGSCGVNEYSLNVVLKDSHRKNPDIPARDENGDELWSIRGEFLKDLKARVGKLNINPEDHDEIFQQMENISFSYNREDGGVYE